MCSILVLDCASCSSDMGPSLAPKSTVPFKTWRMPPPLPIDWQLICTSGCSLLYSLNHLEYIGYGKVAPAPFSVVWQLSGSARVRPANSSSNMRSIRRITRGVLLVLDLGVQFCFMGEILKEGYNGVNF